MTNDELLDLAEQIDITLIKWCTENKLSPLTVFAVILARMTFVVRETHIDNDFIKLLKTVKESLQETDNTGTLH